MGKMSEISITLNEYEEKLYTFGYLNAEVEALAKELIAFGFTDELECVQCVYDEYCYHNAESEFD